MNSENDVKESFGVDSNSGLNNYLTFGYFKREENYDSFCRRVNGVSLVEHMNNQRKLRRKLNKKTNQYKVYITKIDSINSNLKKIVLKGIPKKDIIVLNVYFSYLNEIITDPTSKMKLNTNGDVTIEYSYDNITNIEIHYLIVDIDYKIVDINNLNEITLKAVPSESSVPSLPSVLINEPE